MVRRLARNTRRALLPFLAVGALAACHHARIEAALPTGAQRFTAPLVYEKWWAMTAGCSGSTGSISSVQWFVVPGVSLFWRDGSIVNGYWLRDGNKIVLAEGAMEDGAVVRHEMLHAQQSEGRHTRAFIEQCGGIVGCLTACVEAARRSAPVRAALARVSEREMEIDVGLDSATNDGHFALTVSVRNPSSDSVVVELPRPAGSSPRAWFRFELSDGTIGIANSTLAQQSDAMVFGPGEIRRAVFDLRLTASFDGARGLPAGTYSVRGGFGSEWSVPRSFVLGQ
jgi:hypothetical protein